MSFKFNWLTMAFAIVLLVSCSEKEKDTMSEFDKNIPILDRDLFFGNPEISGGQLSPDGQYISFLKEYDGIMNIWVKKFDASFDDAKPLTNSSRPLYGYFWTRDGKNIVYVKDNEGDENMNVFVVDPSAETSEGDSVPTSRNLTPFEDVSAQLYHASQNDPDLFMIGINNRDKAWHDLYELRISTGDLKLVYENKDRITGYDFDWNDELRLLYQTDEQGNTSFLYYKDGQLVPIYETSVTENAGVTAWNKDNTKFYLVTNKGDLNFSTLYLMDPETGEMEFVENDPENRVDFGNLIMNRNTREIIGTSYTDDKTRYYWRDEDREQLYEFLKEEFPGREVSFSSATLDYGKFLISVSGDKYASESWFLDAKSRDLIHQYTPRPELKKVEEYLAPMKPVRYASSDGLEIPAYLTLPVGKEAKDLPTVILVHGGPKGPRDYWGYNSFVQFLANRGYAVLQPNFRASGGYGKTFMNAGDLEWGKLMQDDITWGVKHLVKEGIANPDKVCIMGGSYGGYATLAGLAFTPEVYACGVDIVGPSNIFTLLESIPPYWEAGRAFLHGMVGDPSTEEGKERITEASPLFSADKINKPLLVIQGANDPRVKKAEADQIVIALRDNGHEVSYLLADDEGHGFAKPVNNMAMFAEIERFLAPILGGRFQEDMPEDVAERLEEIRMDISSVEYSPIGDIEIDSVLPAFELNFNEEKRGYRVEINLGEQNIPMKLIRSYQQKDGKWIVTDKSSSAMGESVDKITYAMEGKPLERLIEQQGQEIKVVYNRNSVEVTMKDKVENIQYEGALLVSGPGYEDVLATMEIPEEGMILNAMDVTSMKMKPVKVTMLDPEVIEDVEYDVILTHDVENENDKTTTWVNKETRAVLKSIQISPQMNNAEIITTRMK